jgi:hypothetical protein
VGAAAARWRRRSLIGAARTLRAAETATPTPAALAPDRKHLPAGWAERTTGPFTLDIGGLDGLDHALESRDSMQRLTEFQGWVVPAGDGELKPCRVVLGLYRTRMRAESAADMLRNSHTLRYVTVVPLPPQSLRQLGRSLLCPESRLL